MTELVAQVALGNLIVSALIAGLAWAVDRSGRSPSLAHVLWVLVLVKVLAPPLLTLPLLPAAGMGSPPTGLGSDPPSSNALGVLGGAAAGALPWALAAWAIGSVVVLVVSISRIRHFDDLVRRSSTPGTPALRSIADEVATRMGLRSAPDLLVTSAAISPMTWWTGGRIRVVLPASLCERLDDDVLQWVIAHELAHVKRRDHMVRWLEWLACVAFWWNPVVWLARQRLRHDEEASCDALVIARLGGRPQSYARALLSVVELLAPPSTRPPAVATGIDAGGRLERRFIRILAAGPRRGMPRQAVGGLLGSALVLATLGIGATSLSPSSPAIHLTAADLAGVRPDGETTDVPLHAPTASSTGYALLSGHVSADAVTTDPTSGDGGHDVLTGGRGPDLLVGRGGADRLNGGPGPDVLLGGRGDDTLVGGTGSDAIRGGPGDDVVRTAHDGAADDVDCGAGDGDRAFVDPVDTTVGCEVVIVR